MQSNTQAVTVSKASLWTGRIISTLAVLFMVFDGVTKVMKVKSPYAAIESHFLRFRELMG
jgi:hypothetical protein